MARLPGGVVWRSAPGAVSIATTVALHLLFGQGQAERPAATRRRIFRLTLGRRSDYTEGLASYGCFPLTLPSDNGSRTVSPVGGAECGGHTARHAREDPQSWLME